MQKKVKRKSQGLLSYLQIKKRAFLSFMLTYRLITVLFAFSLFFFLWQHSTGFSWDFAVHTLNAQYLFSDGYYFEWLRPPLPTLLIGVFGFLGFALAEYAYIILVSILYLYSSVRFADSFGIDRTSYYFFSMSVFTFVWAFFAGTELLALALLQLALAYFNARSSGIFFGLSFLTRYANIPYLILVLFQKNARRFFLTLALIVAVFLPWFAYSYLATGNPFASIVDFFLLNVESRPYRTVGLEDIIYSMGLTLPFFAVGLYKRLGRLNDIEKTLVVLILVAWILYLAAPFKEPRYLFPSITGFAYFSAIAVRDSKCPRNFIVLFAVANIALLMFLLPQTRLDNSDFFTSLAQKDGCRTFSNIWVPLAYYGHPAEPIFYTSLERYGIYVKTDIRQAVDGGYRILLAKFVDDPFTRDMPAAPVIEETDSYIILGSGCLKPEKYNKLFVERINEILKHENKALVCGISCVLEGV